VHHTEPAGQTTANATITTKTTKNTIHNLSFCFYQLTFKLIIGSAVLPKDGESLLSSEPNNSIETLTKSTWKAQTSAKANPEPVSGFWT